VLGGRRAAACRAVVDIDDVLLFRHHLRVEPNGFCAPPTEQRIVGLQLITTPIKDELTVFAGSFKP